MDSASTATSTRASSTPSSSRSAVPAPKPPGPPTTPNKKPKLGAAKPKASPDYQSAASKQKAIRELAACEKVEIQAQLLKTHFENVSAGQITTKELSAALAKLEERKLFDLRWVYLGEDLQDSELEAKEDRLKLFEKVMRFINWVRHPPAQISLST